MRFNGLYLDGETVVHMVTVDKAAFVAWVARMSYIRERAVIIVELFPNGMRSPTAVSKRAMTQWLALVEEAEARGPVLPSILATQAHWISIVEE
jgi:hypothetical protein